jgi:ornithine cyclodeaminase
MHVYDSAAVARFLPYDLLIEALESAFRTETVVPLRTHHTVDVPGAHSGTLMLMPAWSSGDALGVKIVSIFPDNTKHGLASVHANYLLLDARTGALRGIMDGTELTLRRTACASALASRHLSRRDAKTLLMVGTGKLAPHMIAAHATVRPITEVRLWGRSKVSAQSLADEMADMPFGVSVADNLEKAVKEADIISCATLAVEPLIHGAWLRPGQHLDLVGAFTPQMREADTNAICRCDVFVDTYPGASTEAGEIVQAIQSGDIALADLEADLAQLVRGEHAGRTSDAALTLFKSVGTALEDLAAAKLVAAGMA